MQKSVPRIVWDILFLVLVALYAFAADIGIVDLSAGGAILDADLATYAQGMAGAMHPEAFASDPVLNTVTPANSIWNLQRWLAECITSPDAPGVALLHIGSITIFVWFAAFYLLGRWLFGRPALAALTSLLMGITIYIEWGTFWGVLQSDPIPRVIYGALWPFLLLAFLVAIQYAWLRPVIMLITGLSIWVHGINALNCGAMFFLAFFFQPPTGYTYRRHLAQCCLSLILFFLPVAIFLWPSFTPRSFSSEELELFRNILQLRWQEDYGHLGQRLLHLVEPLHEFSILWLLVPGTMGWFVVRFRGNQKLQLLAKQYPFFLLALFAVVVFSALEGAFSEATGRLPMGHELVRGLRYVIPLSWLMVVGLIDIVLANNTFNRFEHFFPPLVLAFAIVFLLFAQDRQNMAAQHGIHQLINIDLPLEKQARAERDVAHAYREAIAAVASFVPKGEVVFTDGEYMAVRHLAQRPLAYTFKDGYVHYYNRNPEGCRSWWKYTLLMDDAKKHKAHADIVNIWVSTDANWLLFHQADLVDAVTKHGCDIVWNNKDWYLAHRKL